MYFEQLVLEAMKKPIEQGQITVEADASQYFSLLQQRFPFCGSKITWSQVPGSIERRVEPSEYVEQCSRFFEQMSAQFDADTPLLYLSDNAFDFALSTTASQLKPFLPMLFDELPHHHYVMALDGSWCMVFTSENDVAFGKALK